ncbi:OLC1v1013317C1 [Oldenlandia corymbosa var. corymbosa]|uniref:OLC1v1013317C1 n=1 Tax=Oldenlandia corymbosa var. corymbosa TaxID=529605 RepID=A0AAV1DXZ3_OLDCO|nr:OLC1v1013317C1 [Oldenlandia corymbosa var. corymbosa]
MDAKTRISTAALGFGFDRFTNNYKYVRIVAIPNERVQFAPEIYKLGTDDGWSMVEKHYDFDSKSILSFQGCLHWRMLTPMRPPDRQAREFVILTFDLRANTFGRIEVICLNGDELVAITEDKGLGSWKLPLIRNDGPEEEEEEEEKHKITTFDIDCMQVNNSSPLHVQAVIFQPSFVSIGGGGRKL